MSTPTDRDFGLRGEPGDAPTAYQRIQATPEFAELRSKFRGFVFPATIFFLVWYFAYVILAAYFPDFMSTKVVGNINLGLILGLLQFVTTFGITFMYVKWADRVFDPKADEIRERMHLEEGK